jgi:hypothetical protein
VADDFYDIGYKSGYKAGWQAANDYAKDVRILNTYRTGCGSGIAFMFGGLLIAINLLAWAKGNQFSAVLDGDAVLIGLTMLGLVIDKQEKTVYKRKKAEHDEKWKNING